MVDVGRYNVSVVQASWSPRPLAKADTLNPSTLMNRWALTLEMSSSLQWAAELEMLTGGGALVGAAGSYRTLSTYGQWGSRAPSIGVQLRFELDTSSGGGPSPNRLKTTGTSSRSRSRVVDSATGRRVHSMADSSS